MTYTVRIRMIGGGEDIKMSHHKNLDDAIYVVKQHIKTGRYSATIWRYDY